MTQPNNDQIREAARERVQCGGCLGTGTMAHWYNDGSFDPVDCDCCDGQGFVWRYPSGQCRTRFGRFA